MGKRNKRNGFRILAGIVVLISGLGAFAGCSARGEKTDAEDTAALPYVKESTSQEKENTSDNGRTESDNPYAEILWDVYYLGQIDGTQVAFPNAEGNINGSFAIYDVDGDGCEELLLYFDGGSMASNVGYIWGYKDGDIHEELSQYPSMRYYNNGIIEADWAHNQGLSGDFWPYSVYIYNSETDEYQEFGTVDAWDKIYTGVEINSKGEPFPASIDTDGDGIVYYISLADGNRLYNTTLVDGKDYESWRNDYLDNAEEIKDISFQTLTVENISKLEAPCN